MQDKIISQAVLRSNPHIIVSWWASGRVSQTQHIHTIMNDTWYTTEHTLPDLPKHTLWNAQDYYSSMQCGE